MLSCIVLVVYRSTHRFGGRNKYSPFLLIINSIPCDHRLKTHSSILNSLVCSASTPPKTNKQKQQQQQKTQWRQVILVVIERCMSFARETKPQVNVLFLLLSFYSHWVIFCLWYYSVWTNGRSCKFTFFRYMNSTICPFLLSVPLNFYLWPFFDTFELFKRFMIKSVTSTQWLAVSPHPSSCIMW